jgi:hypothetical protein
MPECPEMSPPPVPVVTIAGMTEYFFLEVVSIAGMTSPLQGGQHHRNDPWRPKKRMSILLN